MWLTGLCFYLISIMCGQLDLQHMQKIFVSIGVGIWTGANIIYLRYIFRMLWQRKKQRELFNDKLSKIKLFQQVLQQEMDKIKNK